MSWEGYGVIVRGYTGRGDLNIGVCPNCGEKCGHDLYSFDGAEVAYERTEYTVSDGSKVLAQGIENEEAARLMSYAPDLRKVIRLLVETGSMIEDSEGWSRCSFCGAEPDQYPGQSAFVPHDRSCVWRQATEVLHRLNRALPVPIIDAGLEEK